MKRYLLVLILLGWAGTGCAETWEWVDNQGTVNFTDDLQNVPKQYRRSARKLGDMSATPAAPAATPSESPRPTDAKEAAPGQSGAAAPSPEGKPRDSYGGKSAAEWKEAFSSLNGEIRATDGQLKEKQQLLKEPGTLTRSEYLKLEDEIRRLSSSLTALLARWELLSKEATAAGVPGELRK